MRNYYLLFDTRVTCVVVIINKLNLCSLFLSTSLVVTFKAEENISPLSMGGQLGDEFGFYESHPLSIDRL